jgi:hypothetical protein
VRRADAAKVSWTKSFFTEELAKEIGALDDRTTEMHQAAIAELDAIRRVQESRKEGPTLGRDSPIVYRDDDDDLLRRQSGRDDDALPGRALCMLHKRPPLVTIHGRLEHRLPQDTVIEQHSLFELRLPRARQPATDIHQFNNVDFKVEFVFASSAGAAATGHAKRITVKGHYNGHTSFVVRFSPMFVGFWTYCEYGSHAGGVGRRGVGRGG